MIDRHRRPGTMEAAARSPTVNAAAAVGVFVVALGCTGATRAGEAECGKLEHSFGPFDYSSAADRNRDRGKNLKLVEQHHFTPEVETLRSGATGKIGADLDYTLKAWPNHHRALKSMAQLALRERTDRPAGAKYSVDCYFDRGMRMNPKDGVVPLLYANFLHSKGRVNEALVYAGRAYELMPESRDVNYNLGLLYLAARDYENARIHARKAYELGHPLPGLRDKLRAAGQWQE